MQVISCDTLPLQTVLRGYQLGTIRREVDMAEEKLAFVCCPDMHASMMRGVPANPTNAAEPEPLHYASGDTLPPTLLAQLVKDGQLREWRKDGDGVQWFEVNHAGSQIVRAWEEEPWTSEEATEAE